MKFAEFKKLGFKRLFADRFKLNLNLLREDGVAVTTGSGDSYKIINFIINNQIMDRKPQIKNADDRPIKSKGHYDMNFIDWDNEWN